MPETLLFPIEVRRFFEEPRSTVILPAAILVPFLSLWPYFSSPWVPALAATFACMEPHYLNMWSLWPHQLEGLALRPIDWRRAIAVKNLAALCLTLLVFSLFAAISYYFHSGTIPVTGFLIAFQDCAVAGMVLAMFGNNYSIVSPRSRIGWTLSDMAASILALIVVGIAMIPIIVLSYLIGPWSARGILFFPALLLWATWSLPGTAARLTHSIPELWTTTTYS